MKRASLALLGSAAVCLTFAAANGTAQRGGGVAGQAPQAPAPAAVRPVTSTPRTSATASTSPEQLNQVVRKYCATCHSDRAKAGGLTLASFDVAKAADHADVAERMIVKLQAGMMPPAPAARPDAATYQALISTLETTIDRAAAARPNPGNRPFQRLNRAEYARAIEELLGLKVNAGSWLPLDTMSAGFDNIADEQALSPMLLESYLNAAAAISRMAVGDAAAETIDATYTNSSYVSQHPWDHVEGAPFGTRGGMVVEHVFPADAEYVFEVAITSGDNARGEDIDISVDGERVALLQYETGPAGGADGRGGVPMYTEPILIRAGQRKVSAAFVRKTEGPYEDLIRPHEWSYAGGGSGGPGVTTLPHLRDLVIKGPYRATGISETPSRRRIFVCRPVSPADERPCARSIVSRLAADAYRRPVTSAEVDRLMPFYERGAAEGGFEAGVRQAVEAVLASPHFIFRLERSRDAGQPAGTYRIADVDLATRLAFFLWGTPPDADLVALAQKGELSKPGGLERVARQMLADPRAEALGTRFAAQWLRLQDIDKVKPDTNFYPNFDQNLADAMKRETELFFYHLVKDDRPFLEFFTADYSYLNERLARHYGIRGVAGHQFRRVAYPDDTRRGVLGHGSVLVLTSLANRTSPVLRGKWVMEVLLGSPPPPPPPDVPTLEEIEDAREGKLLTTRERMEIHRQNPTCNSCHRFMDPIGLALDNFDVTARYRVRENGAPLDTRGDFYDGTPVTSLNELVAALLKRPQPLLRSFTEHLMAYALGRRVEYFDQPTIRSIVRAAEADGYRMSAFVLGVIKSDAFRLRRAETAATTDGAVHQR
ncbi:MAG: DUF1592 domain-containing protein [Acidobacteriota bacterium]